MTYYQVRILDAKYDPDNGMLIINGALMHNSEKKLIIFSKDDVSHAFGLPDLGDKNMHYFAQCLAKREAPFKFGVDDDPKREQLSGEEQLKYAALFSKQIGDELEKVSDGLKNEWGQVQRKLGRMAADGKLDAAELLKEETIVRGKLGM